MTRPGATPAIGTTEIQTIVLIGLAVLEIRIGHGFKVAADDAVTTKSILTAIGACVFVDLIAVITGFKPLLTFHSVESFDAITTASRDAVVGARVRLDEVAVITVLDVRVQNPVPTAVRLAGGETGILLLFIAVVTDLIFRTAQGCIRSDDTIPTTGLLTGVSTSIGIVFIAVVAGFFQVF